MQRIKKAYAESGDLKIIPDTPPLDGSENWEQGRGAYYELDNDPNTGDPLALDIDREQDNYFKNVISKNIKHWQENTYPVWFNDIKYPKNATVKYTDGNVYVSLVDNNTALPTNATNWTIYNPSSLTSLDGQFVKLTGNETIAGVKTFSSSPIVPTPTTNTQAANKAYVDSVSGGGAWSANDTRAKTALNASGNAPIYACRAWVNFNGTGTIAIRASGNVSSITDKGTGDYTVNFTTAMPNANYSVIQSACLSATTGGADKTDGATPYNFTPSGVSVTVSDGTNKVDLQIVCVSIII